MNTPDAPIKKKVVRERNANQAKRSLFREQTATTPGAPVKARITRNLERQNADAKRQLFLEEADTEVDAEVPQEIDEEVPQEIDEEVPQEIDAVPQVEEIEPIRIRKRKMVHDTIFTVFVAKRHFGTP